MQRLSCYLQFCPGLNQPSLEAPSVGQGGVGECSSKSEDDDRLSRFLEDAAKTNADEQASMLKFRLDEAIKTLDAERK